MRAAADLWLHTVVFFSCLLIVVKFHLSSFCFIISCKEEAGEARSQLPLLLPDWWGGGELEKHLNSWSILIINNNHVIKVIIVLVRQPIGALLLEQCKVEREDSQSFSLGELQPHFVFITLRWHTHWLFTWLSSLFVQTLFKLLCVVKCIAEQQQRHELKSSIIGFVITISYMYICTMDHH